MSIKFYTVVHKDCLHEGTEVDVDRKDVRALWRAHDADAAQSRVDVELGNAAWFVFENLFKNLADHPELKDIGALRKVLCQDCVGFCKVERLVVIGFGFGWTGACKY